MGRAILNGSRTSPAGIRCCLIALNLDEFDRHYGAANETFGVGKLQTRREFISKLYAKIKINVRPRR